jgi:hypothetical protein
MLIIVLWGPLIEKMFTVERQLRKPVTTVDGFIFFIHYESNNRRNEALTEGARFADEFYDSLE